MPHLSVGSIGDQTPKPRIVQCNNKRYSIRLEPIFWQSLENQAERRQMRLGQFIGHLAANYRGNNFASFLRVFSILEAERALARAALKATHNSLMDVVATCACPGLVLSRYRTIVGFNQSFLNWLGPDTKSLTGADLTSIVQVRTKQSLNDAWLDMVSGRRSVVEARVLHVTPGKVIAAHATILALNDYASEEFYAVMWLSPQSGLSTH